jgi:hypothetical protein
MEESVQYPEEERPSEEERPHSFGDNDDDISFASAQDHHSLMNTIHIDEFESTTCEGSKTFLSPMDKAGLLWTKSVIDENVALRRLVTTLCNQLQLQTQASQHFQEVINNCSQDSTLFTSDVEESGISFETLFQQYKPTSSEVIDSLGQEITQTLSKQSQISEKKDGIESSSSRNSKRVASHSSSTSNSPPKKHTNVSTAGLENAEEDESYFHHSEDEEDAQDHSPFHTQTTNNGGGPRSKSTDMTGWIECTEVHPPPPFDFDSPVVTHVLSTWTDDQSKVTQTFNKY